jgi:hypothetical protein
VRETISGRIARDDRIVLVRVEDHVRVRATDV